MRKPKALAALMLLATGISMLLVSCQSSKDLSLGAANPDDLAKEQEIQEMVAKSATQDARMQNVAPAIWIDVRADSVRIHTEPPFFTDRTLPQFEDFLSTLNVNEITRDGHAAEWLQGQLNNTLDNIKLEWEGIERLSAAQKQELFDRYVQPNLSLDQNASVGPAYLLSCTRASAMSTTAGPGAKAYAKGSCENAFNSSYARAMAEGSVDSERDSGQNGSYAAAVKYGKWSCSSYGSASASVTVSGFPVTISSDSASHNGCN